MKKQLIAATLLLLGTSQAQAFSQETHKRIVLDAVNYMQQHPASTEYAANPVNKMLGRTAPTMAGI